MYMYVECIYNNIKNQESLYINCKWNLSVDGFCWGFHWFRLARSFLSLNSNLNIYNIETKKRQQKQVDSGHAGSHKATYNGYMILRCEFVWFWQEFRSIRDFMSRLQTRVDSLSNVTRLALHFAAPMERARTSFNHDELLRPIASSATHQVTTVHTD